MSVKTARTTIDEVNRFAKRVGGLPRFDGFVGSAESHVPLDADRLIVVRATRIDTDPISGIAAARRRRKWFARWTRS